MDSPQEKPTGLGYRLDGCCSQGRRSQRSIHDRNEDSNAEFKSSGTKLYGHIKDNMLIASKF